MNGIRVADNYTHPWSLEVYRPASGWWAEGCDARRPHRDHFCYFCHPAGFPPMLPKHTLCVLCGGLIRIPDEDPMNAHGWVCESCEESFHADWVAGRIG